MRSIFLAIAIVVCVIIIVFIIKNNSDQDDDYFKNINLKMTGILKENPDCPNGYNGFCVLSVAVIHSNISDYDPRNKLSSYYCIIKGDQAEIYQLMASDCRKGDTIVIDTRDRTFQCMRTKVAHPILLNTNKSWYQYLSEHHQKL